MTSNIKKSHPIIGEILSLAKTRQISETSDKISTLFFDEEAIEKIKGLLWNYQHSNEIRDIIEEIILLAYFLDQKKHAKDASQALMDMLSTEMVHLLRSKDNSEHGVAPPEKK
ncbi:MAG: hypothetical protein ACFFCZ_04065 [Promethearchaeota archaeon]